MQNKQKDNIGEIIAKELISQHSKMETIYTLGAYVDWYLNLDENIRLRQSTKEEIKKYVDNFIENKYNILGFDKDGFDEDGLNLDKTSALASKVQYVESYTDDEYDDFMIEEEER